MRILLLCCALLLAGCNAPAPETFTLEETLSQITVTSIIPSKQVKSPDAIELFEAAMDEATESKGAHTDEGPRHTVEMTYADNTTASVDIFYSALQGKASFVIDATRYNVNETHVDEFIEFFEAL